MATGGTLIGMVHRNKFRTSISIYVREPNGAQSYVRSASTIHPKPMSEAALLAALATEGVQIEAGA